MLKSSVNLKYKHKYIGLTNGRQSNDKRELTGKKGTGTKSAKLKVYTILMIETQGLKDSYSHGGTWGRG